MYLYVLCETHSLLFAKIIIRAQKDISRLSNIYLGFKIITAVLLRVLTRHFYGKTMVLIEAAGVWF